jgi:hypothetical protein
MTKGTKKLFQRNCCSPNQIKLRKFWVILELRGVSDNKVDFLHYSEMAKDRLQPMKYDFVT